MKDARLTPAQMAALEPFEEKYLRTWRDAKWCRPLPASLVDAMLAAWEAATGSRRPFRSGCPGCEKELLADICKLYYNTAQEPAAETAEPAEAPAPKKAPGAKKVARNAKKKASNTTK